MSDDRRVSRRVFLNYTVSAGAALPLIAFAAGCKSESGGDAKSKEPAKTEPTKQPAEPAKQAAAGDVQCDMSKLTEQDLAPRKALGYVDKTPNPDKRCDNCALYKQGDGCNGCTLFPGPVKPEGYCNSWAPKKS